MIIKIKFQGKILELYLERHSDFSVFYDIFVEREYSNLIDKIQNGDIILDAGANIGMFTVVASILVGDDGLVVSIEPDPKNLDILKKNVVMNNLKNVKIINKALYSSSNEKIPFYSNGGLSKIVDDDAKDSGTILVETITLDDILTEYKISPNVLKMDIEGGEKFALLGAENTMERISRFWAEIHSEEDFKILMKFSNQFSIKKETVRSVRNSLPFMISHPLKTLILEYNNRFNAFRTVFSTLGSVYRPLDNSGIYFGEKT